MTRPTLSCRTAAGPRARVGLASALGGCTALLIALVGAEALALLPPPWAEWLVVSLLVGLPIVGVSAAMPPVRRALASAVGPHWPMWRDAHVRSFALGGGIAACGLIAWHGSLMCWSDMTRSMSAGHLGLSGWMFSLWIPFLSLALALRQGLALARER